jgi:hypothetical protein
MFCPIHDGHRIFDEFPMTKNNFMYELLFETILGKLNYGAIVVFSPNSTPIGGIMRVYFTKGWKSRTNIC